MVGWLVTSKPPTQQRHGGHMEEETDGGGDEGNKRSVTWEESRYSSEKGKGEISTHSIRFALVPPPSGVGAKLSTSQCHMIRGG